jgi:hypothetical protein
MSKGFPRQVDNHVWNVALVKKLCDATGKPDVSLKYAVTKLAENLNIDLSELHCKTVVCNGFVFKLKPYSNIITVTTDDAALFVDVLSFETPFLAQKKFMEIREASKRRLI